VEKGDGILTEIRQIIGDSHIRAILTEAAPDIPGIPETLLNTKGQPGVCVLMAHF
jgi:hypothetical protein